MTKEYVGNFGGGLVVIAGPRFGPRELREHAAGRHAAGDRRSEPAEFATHRRPEFRLRLTPARRALSVHAAGPSDGPEKIEGLGQPRASSPGISRSPPLHTQASPWPSIPTDMCADGKTPQPLIAVRQYGKGEVVYLGFNETWRLRRKYGEKYYRQFWSQLIYRLGMSHALGSREAVRRPHSTSSSTGRKTR